MISVALDGSQFFYRAHTPEWASQPLSGAGAAMQGGRLNRPGTHAVYLSDSSATAIAEYQQLAPIMPPCTLVTYTAKLNCVVDFRAGYVPGIWPALWQDLYCNWRKLALLDGIEPPSWVLADAVIAAGFVGVLFASVHTKGVNLVVYPDALKPVDQLAVHDPQNTLPRNRSSWK